MHEILERRAQESMEGEWFRATQATIDHAIEKTELQGASNQFWSEANEAFTEEARVSFNRWRHRLYHHADKLRDETRICPMEEPDAEWVRENAEWIASRIKRIEKRMNTLMRAICFIPFLEDWPGT